MPPQEESKMAQFYGEVQGTRGLVSRMGDKVSGMWGHIRGWGVGASVQCWHGDGKDVVYVTRTGGSCGGRSVLVATLTEDSITLHKPNGKPSITYKV